MPRNSPFEIRLTDGELAMLRRRAAAYTAPYRDVVRAKIVLMAADGLPNKEIAHRLSLPVQVVTRWRKRFYHERLSGLEERPRTGRPATQQPNSG